MHALSGYFAQINNLLKENGMLKHNVDQVVSCFIQYLYNV